MKKSFTVTINEDIIKRIRNAAYWERISINKLAESYIDEGLLRDEDENGGLYDERPYKPIFK